MDKKQNDLSDLEKLSAVLRKSADIEIKSRIKTLSLVPILGMLMLPKTVCYVLMVISFIRAISNE